MVAYDIATLPPIITLFETINALPDPKTFNTLPTFAVPVVARLKFPFEK